jgi:hypothetical protein
MKYLVILVLILILTACAASEPSPQYLVRVGSSYSWRCGGYAIDQWHIITADHCQHISRALLADGATVPLRSVARWPAIDTAMYETDEPLHLDNYATLLPIAVDRPAYAFGFCPAWNSSAARFAEYTATEKEPLYCHRFHMTGSYICNGDSGGVIEQDDNVVGMISKFRGASFALDNSTNAAFSTCAVPGDAIAERVEEWRGER